MTADLEALMNLTLEGDSKAAEQFYLSFLETELYAGERGQSESQSNAPAYPNPLLNLLAVQDSERTVVPVFTGAEQAEEWAGRELELRKISGADLIKLLPDDWWIALNPASEINKEFSPWELSQLRAGKESIPEIVHELGLGISEEFQVERVSDDEYPKLRDSLIVESKQEQKISALYILREVGEDSEGRKFSVVLIGAEIESDIPLEMESIHQKLQKTADHAQIGTDRVRIYSGRSLASLSLGMFKECQPFYSRKSS